MIEERTVALVIGAGPVGMAAALDLNWRGVPTILINDRSETATHPKCNHTSGRSMEYFRRIGVAEAVRNGFIPANMPGSAEYVTRFCGHEFGRFESQLPRPGETGGGFAGLRATAEPPKLIAQPLLEKILKGLLDEAPNVDVRFGCKAIAIEETDEAVEVAVQVTETGEKRRIRADYVIACDGAGSFVRKSLGIPLEGEDGSRSGVFMSGAMLSYHVRSPNLLERTGRPLTTVTNIIAPDLRGVAFLQDTGTRWIFHYQVPQGIDPASLDPRDVVARMIGDDEVEFEILSGGPWTGGQALVAEHYQTRRIFLCGDAAHLVTPMGGTGMNTGIGDAMNLTWKISAAYEGWAGRNLLQTYDAERWPMGVRNSQFGLIFVRLHNSWRLPEDIEEPGAQADARRLAFGEAVISADKTQYSAPGLHLGDRYESSPLTVSDGTPPPADNYLEYFPCDRAGGRLPHFTLPDGRALQDLLGKGFTLLNFAGADTSRLEAEGRVRNIPLTVLRLPKPEAETGFTRALVLARPDLFVAWSGDALPDDVGTLLDVVRGAASIKIPQSRPPVKDLVALCPIN